MIDHKDMPDWIIRLRRRPASLSVNHQDDGADMFEIICRMCGDDPALDYRQVSAELRQIRGCYPLRIGLVPFFQHQEFHSRADRRSIRLPPTAERAAGGRQAQPGMLYRQSRQAAVHVCRPAAREPKSLYPPGIAGRPDCDARGRNTWLAWLVRPTALGGAARRHSGNGSGPRAESEHFTGQSRERCFRRFS
jgi:hypothetical protein